jgi:hypothetical protein
MLRELAGFSVSIQKEVSEIRQRGRKACFQGKTLPVFEKQFMFNLFASSKRL